jgi:hypothetical protein
MIVVIAHAENTITQIRNTEIYMVHPNVGVRPPSRGIDFLIIQIMEITTASLMLSQPLWAYMKIILMYIRN